jgi:hypothetical protein
MEWARTNKNRGLLAAWPQFGGPAGLFLANLPPRRMRKRGAFRAPFA